MRSDKVVFIDAVRRDTSDSYRPSGGAEASATYSATAEADSVKRNVTIGTSALYAFADPDESLVVRAITLLNRAHDCFKAAALIDPSIDYFDFDSNLMRARGFLSQAFLFREIGSGYAAIVNASIWALTNSTSQPLSRRQLHVLDSAIQRVISGPYLHFDTAMNVIDEMEDADLDVDPELIDSFFDTKDEE